MARKRDMRTNETARALAALTEEKANLRREVRQALAAWRVAKKNLTYAVDGDARVNEVEVKLRAKIAAMNGRVSEINETAARYREIHKARGERYEAEQRAAREQRRKGRLAQADAASERGGRGDLR
jgi:hypothetical protein